MVGPAMSASTCVLFLVGCATASAATWPTNWASHRGEKVTVDGKAANAKLGALLIRDDGGDSIWIDGLQEWPEGYYRGGETGKRVRVTGVVIEKDDLPVFVQKPGEPIMQGIPVESEQDLAHARHRYLLKDATWAER